MKTLVPSEDFEQTLFVEWLESNGYKYTSIPNSTFTRSWKQLAKNKRNGLKPGLPDLLIVLKKKSLLFVEMKRTRGGRVSPEQREWIAALNSIENCSAVVATGCECAKKLVREEEKR